MIEYRLTLSIGYSNASQEEIITTEDMGYKEEDWNKLSNQDKEDELENHWQHWSANYLDGGWSKVE